MVFALAEPLPAPPLAAEAIVARLQSSHCCGPWGVERVEINKVRPTFQERLSPGTTAAEVRAQV